MKQIVENPSNVRSADIIVGIPSYNEADCISVPTDTASRGLEEYFPRAKSVIINVDNNSKDGTRDAFMDTPTKVPKIYISTPEGVKGGGGAQRAGCRGRGRGPEEHHAAVDSIPRGTVDGSI